MKMMKRFLSVLLVSVLVMTLILLRHGGIPIVQASPDAYQGDLILIGDNVTVITGQFDINGSIIVENNATLILRNAIVNLTQTGDDQFGLTFQNPANGNPRLIAENATLRSDHRFFVYFYGNSSCEAEKLDVWPASGKLINWYLSDSSSMSMSDSRIYAVVVYGGFFEASNSTMAYLQVLGNGTYVNVSSSNVWYLTSFYTYAQCTLSDSSIGSIYTRFDGLARLVNSTYSSYDPWDTSRITVSWYLDVKITDLGGIPLDFVDVTARYPNFTLIESKLTDANGLARFTLMEKMTNATGSYPVGNYYVDASHVSGAGAGQSVNIAGNKNITLSLYIYVQDYIVINPDGSISPSAANVTTSDKTTYTFTDDNHASVIVVRSNIIINGMGYTVQAPGHTGFSLMDMHNVTIENTTIAGCGSAVSLHACSDCAVTGNNMTGNGDAGVYLSYSSNCTVSDNNITDNGRGILLDFSSDNVVFGNAMTNNTYGNFGIHGYEFSHFVNNIDTSNLANGKPVYCLVNQSDIVVSPQTHPEGIGYLGLISCKNVTVQDMTLTGNGQGLLLAYTNDSLIIRNSFVENGEGVCLYYSSSNVLSGNNVVNCTDEGSSVILVSSPECIVSGNNITGSHWGTGVFVASSRCTVSGNLIADNYYEGIVFSYSSGCTVTGNSITNNGIGINIYSSSGNMLYHNNLVNNTQQVQSDGSPNTWDDGCPSGGNYWSDYAGVDLYHGSNQDVAGGDGIGDNNHTINAGDIDYYPLMGSFETFNAGTWNNTAYNVDIVSNSTVTGFSFNQAEKAVVFNVTGVDGSAGFCRVTIPQGLMWVNTLDEWAITVNGTLFTQCYINETGGYTYIYFNYTHSTETVQIQSTGAIPEFQPLMLLLLSITTALLVVCIHKRKRTERKRF